MMKLKRNKFCIFTIILYSSIWVYCEANMSFVDDLYLHEVRSLSELPLEKLVRLKTSFAKKNTDPYEFGPESRSSSALGLPPAMPMKRMSNKYSISRHDEWDEKGKDSKISKIFQLTVCTLSFLAFGGYLLALIISAIRRNQNQANQGNNVIVLSGLQSLTKVKRPKRESNIYNPMENECDTENLYRGMTILSDQYSYLHYH